MSGPGRSCVGQAVPPNHKPLFIVQTEQAESQSSPARPSKALGLAKYQQRGQKGWEPRGQQENDINLGLCESGTGKSGTQVLLPGK